jgi:hypothetical protein
MLAAIGKQHSDPKESVHSVKKKLGDLSLSNKDLAM